MEKNKSSEYNDKEDRRLKICLSASEWGEHARFGIDNEPCDDGRAVSAVEEGKGKYLVRRHDPLSLLELGDY